MKHMLKTEDLILTLEPQIFDADLRYTSNTIMEVTVASDGFSGKASMDIDAKALGRFSQDLFRLYNTLEGDAQIAEPYGSQMYISFSAIGNGYIAVKGQLQRYSLNGCEQNLKFENSFDQTYLQSFSSELLKTYEKYAGM